MTHPKPDESNPEWMEWFYKKMDDANYEEEALWERRRRRGLGVGLDERGNLIFAEDVLRAEINCSVSMIDQDAAGILLGLSEADPSVILTRHEIEEQILSFNIEGQAVYPRFQFDVVGRRVYPAVIELMKMRPDHWGGQTALIHWLTLPNLSLSGARPCDKLAKDANAILASFQSEISEPLANGS